MGRYGMAGSYFRKSGYVTLQDVPDPNHEYVLNFDNLTGGMNTFDLEFELKPNESPLIRNLSWYNGVLCSRRGQVQVGDLARSGVLCCYQRLWHGWIIAHVGTYLYAWKARIEADEANECPVGTICKVSNLGIERVAGSFALVGGYSTRDQHDEYLLYKTRGAFIRIAYDGGTDPTTVFADTPVFDTFATIAYTPIIQKNTDPDTAGGDQFQPENRLSRFKWVQYNTKWQTDPDTGEVVTDSQGNKVAVSRYRIPISGANVDVVKVDGVQLTSGPDYTIDPNDHDVVVLTNAPAPTDPPRNNTVEILISLENEDAWDSIMSCTKMAVFGGPQDLCVVLGGCEAQPNAYFWSGNDSFGMNPTYFPMNQYNFAGNAPSEITGFGKQQNMLVIFQPRSVGRATFGTVEINERAQITMDYTPINAEIGCDLPRSIQLVENNLVWGSTRDGVCRLKDSSAAYENNIVKISRKVDGNYRHAGLLDMIRGADPEQVWSFDTGQKYVIGYNGQAYEWNYELSDYQNPSWFPHTGIQGVAFVTDLDRIWELTSPGVVAEFQRIFTDFGAGIEKIYVLPSRNFGSYDRLKNIMSVIFTTRGDYHTNTQIEYTCDYGSRIDPTPLVSRSLWSLVPRDLSYRDLSCEAFAFVARRKPGYHNIRHLRIKLYNNDLGADLSLVSAQIFYTFRGRQR